MRSTSDIWISKTILILIFLSVCHSAFSQQKDKPNAYYQSVQNRHSLDSIFPVDDIQSITVTNYNGTHALTKDKLTFLKGQLKKAKFAGGLLLKPGHITLTIKLKANSKAKTGYVYAYKGNINFDAAIDKHGNNFSGTYYLPLAINFDNYK
ncbi:hypothetical protein A4D02_35750 [Niastella koreensis]|uniref:Uncharacterized protein n=2 Tax=Niastella koreensis TaxID=354356 RepID=G8THM6_NIAKG|nr:hypothetical protein [Niastella koreensis]AEV97454.1 hypothetical protein Niako_1078 [Niastella koreensis GR20-10]OQP44164.1 hypothetical protein A4D02_35750 [Niastella koreensis]